MPTGLWSLLFFCLTALSFGGMVDTTAGQMVFGEITVVYTRRQAIDSAVSLAEQPSWLGVEAYNQFDADGDHFFALQSVKVEFLVQHLEYLNSLLLPSQRVYQVVIGGGWSQREVNHYYRAYYPETDGIKNFPEVKIYLTSDEFFRYDTDKVLSRCGGFSFTSTNLVDLIYHEFAHHLYRCRPVRERRVFESYYYFLGQEAAEWNEGWAIACYPDWGHAQDEPTELYASSFVICTRYYPAWLERMKKEWVTNPASRKILLTAPVIYRYYQRKFPRLFSE